MSNGGVGGSRAPYIIICQGRIGVLNAKADGDRLQAASDSAAALVSYYGDKLTQAQTDPISGLQHSMMDNFDSWTKSDVDTAVASMFALLDDLEDEMEGKP